MAGRRQDDQLADLAADQRVEVRADDAMVPAPLVRRPRPAGECFHPATCEFTLDGGMADVHEATGTMTGSGPGKPIVGRVGLYFGMYGGVVGGAGEGGLGSRR